MAYFSDRIDAGKRLAEALADFKGKNGVVLAIPRGGVVFGLRNRICTKSAIGCNCSP